MSKVNRKLAATILLAALEFKQGARGNARALLIKAAEDPDFDETVDGMGQALSEDDFDEEPAFDGDVDDEIASIVKTRKPLKTPFKGKKETADTTNVDDQESTGDPENDNDEEQRSDGIEKEVAKAKQVRANLIALASAA